MYKAVVYYVHRQSIIVFFSFKITMFQISKIRKYVFIWRGWIRDINGQSNDKGTEALRKRELNNECRTWNIE